MYDFDNYRYSTGPNLMVGNCYPKNYSKLFYEGMSSELGNEAAGNIVNLVRCAWAGSQQYGALLWSGDIPSSWQSLKNQFAAGLNAGMAGISWWTVDIGGFHGADVKDPAFHELFIRWFQWAAFLPVMRLHGFRLPEMPRHGTTGGSFCLSGSPNEVWSYGEEVYSICKAYMGVREELKPYTKGLMKEAHEHGDPVIRPMFYEFPADESAWKVEDQYMFGNKYLVAPVFSANTRERQVYLPKGHQWRQLGKGLEEGDVVSGGMVTVACPLDYIPVFAKVK
jgi:alpha-D-xyloside xylohydrolase